MNSYSNYNNDVLCIIIDIALYTNEFIDSYLDGKIDILTTCRNAEFMHPSEFLCGTSESDPQYTMYTHKIIV